MASYWSSFQLTIKNLIKYFYNDIDILCINGINNDIDLQYIISFFKNEEIKDKIKKTNLDKYGFEYPTQNENVKKKIETTCLNKYGFKNPMQNDEIFEKQLKNCFHTIQYLQIHKMDK